MSRARAADAFVVWAISIVAAAMFLIAGLPKIFGLPAIGLQAAAMTDFPGWIRVIVGIVEVAGAIALLVPSTATFASLALAVLMIPAALTQYALRQPGIWVPLLMLALLVAAAWRRNAARVDRRVQEFTGRPHPLLHDGIVAGLIGASCIAVWFLVVDLIGGHPFFTPATLGRDLLGVLGPGADGDGAVMAVLVYTVFHVAAFMLVGLVAALIVSLARREPSILLGFVVLFVATEVGFYGYVGLMREVSDLGRLAWYQVMLGNLVAAAAMGYYFWRTHRELGDEFRHSLDWDTELVPPEFRKEATAAPMPSRGASDVQAPAGVEAAGDQGIGGSGLA